MATAGESFVLAVATFAPVRSANPAARTADRALLVGLPAAGADLPVTIVPVGDDAWACSMGRHWSLDAHDPRR